MLGRKKSEEGDTTLAANGTAGEPEQVVAARAETRESESSESEEEEEEEVPLM